MHGNNNTVIMNNDTKDYINTILENDQEFWIDASVGSA